MTQSFFSWVLKVFSNSDSFYLNSDKYSNLSSMKKWFDDFSLKLKSFDNFNESLFKSFKLEYYNEYFSFINSINLQKDFSIKTTIDNVLIKGTYIKSLFIQNKNKDKLIIFCHGISNNRWSLFYQIHIAIQMGYSVVIYDARNHGLSEKSYTTLGKIESNDLEDIVNWSIKNFNPVSIGLYGFSMGASTLIHWIGKFQDIHKEVKAVFCEAPFDEFEKRFESFFNNESSNVELSNEYDSTKNIEHSSDSSKNDLYVFKAKKYFLYNFVMKILKSPFSIYDVKPIESLPSVLNPKILLIHGLKDNVIDYHSSIEIWKKIKSNWRNKKKIEIYLVKDSGHGDLAIWSDFFEKRIVLPDNLNKDLDLNFSSIMFSFFNKNL